MEAPRNDASRRAGVLLAAAAVYAAGALIASAQTSPVPGRNVNLVAGKVKLQTESPFVIEGDPFLQRQNEPECDASTRNPRHILCGGNDYRAVDLPGLPDSKLTGDAWLGVFWSADGGRTFRSSLLPGFRQDTSPAGAASPLKGLEAAADATVRSGPGGLFYYSGIAFNRGATHSSSATEGLDGKDGKVFLARFVDNNDGPQFEPIYLGTGIMDDGNGGQFLDKPWIAVDVPRAGQGMCSIATADGKTQSVPDHYVYGAYTVFVGNDLNVRTKLHATVYANCGRTLLKRTKISEGFPINQSASIAIDPHTGWVYIVWRQFRSQTQSDAIMFAVSKDFGQTYSKPAVITAISPLQRADLSSISGSFDQGMTSRSFRTNAFPAFAVADSGIAGKPGQMMIAWSQRTRKSLAGQPGKYQRDARIVAIFSNDGGMTWSPSATPIDNSDSLFRGHQFMPTATYANGKFLIGYYDLREDHTRLAFDSIIVPDPGNPAGPDGILGTADDGTVIELLPARDLLGDLGPAQAGQTTTPDPRKVFTDFAVDAAPQNPDPEVAPVYSRHLKRRHTLDVRLIEFAPVNPASPTFPPSVKVSEYLLGKRIRDGVPRVEQFQFNPPGLPLFVTGTRPFIGDYISITPLPRFVPKAGGGWAYNSSAAIDPKVFLVWTDNRNVKPPKDGYSWDKYTPVFVVGDQTSVADPTQQRPACQPDSAGMRNQDLFGAIVAHGLNVTAPGNARTLGMTVLGTVDDPATPIDETEPFLIQRAFPVTVQNMTNQTRHYRLIIVEQPPGSPFEGRASFEQFPKAPFDPNQPVPSPLTEVDVSVGPRSSASRSVFVSSTDPHALVAVEVVELDAVNGSPKPAGQGQRGSAILNPDPNNPDPNNPDPNNPDPNNPDPNNPDPNNAEVYDAVISAPDPNNTNLTVTGVLAPDPNNPDPNNPDPNNPDPNNVLVQFPDPTNPDPNNPDPNNPDPNNPDPNNPDPNNPDPNNGTIWNPDANNTNITNSTLADGAVQDTHWTLRPQGNVPAKYNIKLVENQAVPPGIKLQLIVHKTEVTPIAAGLNGCELKELKQAIVLANVPDAKTITFAQLANPDPNNPDPNNVTVALMPYEEAVITVRVIDPDKNDAVTFTPATAILPAAIPPVNTVDALNGVTRPEPILPLSITTLTLPEGMTGEFYFADLQAVGGDGNYTWNVTEGSLPAGYTLDRAAEPRGRATITGGVSEATSNTFTVSLADGTGRSTARRFTIVVRPFGLTGEAATAEDTSTAILLQGSGPAGTFAIASAPAHGTLSGAPPNVTYTPAPNYSGPDAFTFTFTEKGIQSAPASVYLTVTPVNDGPVALDDVATTAEDSGAITIAVLANDTDVDGDSLTATTASTSANTHGTLTIFPTHFTFAPDADYAGPATFQYEVCDNGTTNGVPDSRCARATVNVTVTPVNDAPVALRDSYATGQGVALSVAAPGVLGNDTDVDSPSLGAVLVSGPSGGTLTFNADGSFTYTPAASFAGTDTFSYRATDGSATSAAATVSIVVAPAISISYILPAVAAAGYGQMITVFGTNIPDHDPADPGRPRVFFTSGALSVEGFVYSAPSVPGVLYVRLPFIGDGLGSTANVPIGPATVSVRAGDLASNAVPITVAEIPGAPVLRHARVTTGDPCAGAAVTPPVVSITRGQGLVLAAFGTDTSGASVTFRQGASALTVPMACSLASDQIGQTIAVTVPAGLTDGLVSVSIQTAVGGIASAESNPLTLSVGGQLSILSGAGTPVLNGTIDSQEWAAAGRIDLAVDIPGGGAAPATFLVMNDAANLYVAFRYRQDRPDASEQVTLEFDRDNNGVQTDGDDLLMFDPISGPFDEYRTSAPPCPPASLCGFLDTSDGGTTDLVQSFTRTGGFTTYEGSHPLNSGDAPHDFALAFGDVIGVFIDTNIFTGRDRAVTRHPSTTFFAMTIATAPPTRPTLLAPVNGAAIAQNVSTIGCQLLPGQETAGYGLRIDFDWSDAVSPLGVAGYEIFAKHPAAVNPILETFVTTSAYTLTNCNAFVADGGLSGWEWRVRARDSRGNYGDWTAPGQFRFEPCRLADGSMCRTP